MLKDTLSFNESVDGGLKTLGRLAVSISRCIEVFRLLLAKNGACCNPAERPEWSLCGQQLLFACMAAVDDQCAKPHSVQSHWEDHDRTKLHEELAGRRAQVWTVTQVRNDEFAG